MWTPEHFQHSVGSAYALLLARVQAGISELEGAAFTFCFPTAMEAYSAIMSALAPGNHIALGRHYPSSAFEDLLGALSAHSISHTALDTLNPEAAARAIQSTTKAVWVQSPYGSMLAVGDIAALCKACPVSVVVDNTLAIGMQKPLLNGAAVVVSSAKHYLSAWSSGDAAYVATNDYATSESLLRYQKMVAAPLPEGDLVALDAALHTLPARISRFSAAAFALAQFLQEQPEVEQVYYPGLPSHPGHMPASAQMSEYGAIIGVVLSEEMDTPAFVRAITSCASWLTCTEAGRPGAGIRIGSYSAEAVIDDISKALEAAGVHG